MRARLLAVAAVALLVLQAGCVGVPTAGTETRTGSSAPPVATQSSAETPTAAPSESATPTATPTPAPSPTPQPDVPKRVNVTGGSLPVNATLVFARVERLLGVSVSAPDVTVRTENGSVPERPVSATYRDLGATNTTTDVATCGTVAGGYGSADRVSVQIGGLDAEEVELLLVHEYVHAIQSQVDTLRANYSRTRISVPGTLSEGGAVYVTELYAREHDLSWGGKSPLELRRCFYRRSGDGIRFISARYYFGALHFQQRLNGSANLSAVYRSPPRTTEELVHGLAGGSEPLAPLAVTVETADGFNGHGRKPGGELLVRDVLTSVLTERRAAEAAAGWGTSRLVEIRNGTGQQAVVWTIRFDDAGEADEFAAAFADYEATAESERGATLRLVRVGEETVVVLGGEPSLVAGATVSGSVGNVTVEMPGTG